ncbi:growth hormone secretagogue receptor type 1 [Biomphalaria pfeifferi]|uniref:Growth hormone secretagogue receptor type 1 n=1 Tax=Biomphalaria pfeifferi TaxID=112525 RepID=A0AAD8B0H2_BIOPF|nr:growth hormone secretagogue receptor type 1 [Biomphalaria pfeifferi]
MSLSTVSQLILVICSTLLTCALKASSSVRFRSSDSVGSLLQTRKRRSKLSKLSVQEKKLIRMVLSLASPTRKRRSKLSKLSIQEKKLIRMVLSLAVLQMACKVPRLSLIVFYNAYPGIGADDRDFAEVIWAAASVFVTIGCTANTFCYYFLNSSYRKVFKSMTGLKSK